MNFIKGLYAELDQTREKISLTYNENTSPLGMIQYMNEFIEGTKVRISTARMEVRELMQNAEDKLELLVEASREVRVLEKLKEKKMSEHKKAANKKETKILDDMITTRVGARR